MSAPTDHNVRRSPHGTHRDPTPDIDSTAGVGAQPDAGHAPQRHSTARFSPKARARLQAARLWIAINRPYYCRALFACPLIPAQSQPTMTIAMDHQWRIFINPEFVECSTVEKTAAVLIHEINHALQIPRRTRPQDRSPRPGRVLEGRVRARDQRRPRRGRTRRRRRAAAAPLRARTQEKPRSATTNSSQTPPPASARCPTADPYAPRTQTPANTS